MLGDKFIWEEGDLVQVSKEDFDASATLYEVSLPYEGCTSCKNCCKCDEEDQGIAEILAKKVYESYFRPEKLDRELLEQVLHNSVFLCKKLLAGKMVLTKQLYCAYRMQLLELFVQRIPSAVEEIKAVFEKTS